MHIVRPGTATALTGLMPTTRGSRTRASCATLTTRSHTAGARPSTRVRVASPEFRLSVTTTGSRRAHRCAAEMRISTSATQPTSGARSPTAMLSSRWSISHCHPHPHHCRHHHRSDSPPMGTRTAVSSGVTTLSSAGGKTHMDEQRPSTTQPIHPSQSAVGLVAVSRRLTARPSAGDYDDGWGITTAN